VSIATLVVANWPRYRRDVPKGVRMARWEKYVRTVRPEPEVGANIDECPGAMFIWESQEPADAHPTDARSNQDLGRDLYFALRHRVLAETGPCERTELKNRMAWWEVRFSFE
jgi:hypothetical protein